MGKIANEISGLIPIGVFLLIVYFLFETAFGKKLLSDIYNTVKTGKLPVDSGLSNDQKVDKEKQQAKDNSNPAGSSSGSGSGTDNTGFSAEQVAGAATTAAGGTALGAAALKSQSGKDSGSSSGSGSSSRNPPPDSGNGGILLSNNQVYYPTKATPVIAGTQNAPASTKTATGITIFSKVGADTWRVTLSFSDGSKQNYVLSTGNVNSWISQGAVLTDLTGQFGQALANQPVTTPSPNTSTTIPNPLHRNLTFQEQVNALAQKTASDLHQDLASHPWILTYARGIISNAIARGSIIVGPE